MYECGGNVCWADPLANPNHGVPYNMAAVQKFKNHYFSDTPKRFPHAIVVALQENQDPCKHKGALQVLSPIEEVHALYFAIADAINNGASDQTMEKWKWILLTVTIVFEICKTPEAARARSLTLRDQVVADFHGLAWTVPQRIFSVVAFKERKESITGKMSAAALSSKYNEYIQLASDSEAISEAWVDNAMTVYNRMFTDPKMLALVMALDNAQGLDGPFNSVYKLHGIVTRTKTRTYLSWVMDGISDLFKAGILYKGDLTMKQINPPGGQRGLVDLLMHKYDLKEFLLSEWVDETVADVEVRAKIRSILKDHASYRTSFGWHTATVDMTWSSTWPESSRKVLELIEATLRMCRHARVCIHFHVGFVCR